MSYDLFTFVGHRHLAFMNPISEATYARVMDLLALRHGATIADFGSGFGELPLRLIERFRVHADCVELSPRIASVARDRAAKRVPVESIRIHEGDAGAFKATIPPESFDLTICIGSSHALGGYSHMLQTLARLTRRGGNVLVGQLFWKKAPPKAYLEHTGQHEDDLGTFSDLLEFAAAQGLTCDFATSASEQDFDHYEWALARNIEQHAREHGDDPAAKAMLARSREWRAGYTRWGRECLGFGLALLRT